jgi:polyferredoxin
MAKIGKPPGLVRYGSRDAFEGRVRGWLRARVVLYPLALAGSLIAFVWMLGARADAEVTVLRGLGAPYTLQAGTVVNQVRVKVTNRGERDRRFSIELSGAPEARLIAPMNPLPVPAGEIRGTSLFVLLPPAAFEDGERAVEVAVRDGERYQVKVPYRLLGPEEEEASR